MTHLSRCDHLVDLVLDEWLVVAIQEATDGVIENPTALKTRAALKTRPGKLVATPCAKCGAVVIINLSWMTPDV